MMQATNGYLDLNKCGFSLRSLSSIPFKRGAATLSICSVLSTLRLFTGKLLSSKQMNLFFCILRRHKNYFVFFCASAASFILRMASSRVMGWAFSLSSFHTCSRSLPSNGLNIFFSWFFIIGQSQVGSKYRKENDKLWHFIRTAALIFINTYESIKHHIAIIQTNRFI